MCIVPHLQTCKRELQGAQKLNAFSLNADAPAVDVMFALAALQEGPKPNAFNLDADVPAVKRRLCIVVPGIMTWQPTHWPSPNLQGQHPTTVGACF